MDELNQRERAAYAAVDDAMRTYPLQPAPKDMLPAVLARLQARQTPPLLRLTWLEAALASFTIVMAGLIFGLWPLLPIPVDWSARLQFRALVWWQQVRYGEGWAALGLILAFLALLTIWETLKLARGNGLSRAENPGEGA